MQLEYVRVQHHITVTQCMWYIPNRFDTNGAATLGGYASLRPLNVSFAISFRLS